ncbi:MAG: hypothetical protein AB7I98_09790 [Verrucomicrobiales bacterium]
MRALLILVILCTALDLTSAQEDQKLVKLRTEWFTTMTLMKAKYPEILDEHSRLGQQYKARKAGLAPFSTAEHVELIRDIAVDLPPFQFLAHAE